MGRPEELARLNPFLRQTSAEEDGRNLYVCGNQFRMADRKELLARHCVLHLAEHTLDASAVRLCQRRTICPERQRQDALRLVNVVLPVFIMRLKGCTFVRLRVETKPSQKQLL